MPIKKKTTAAKKPAAKKPVVLGPKAKLMKLLVGTLRNKAKKLGISDVAKRTKENLAQSIMLAEARKKKGTTLGKKATAKKKLVSTRGADRQTKGTPNDSLKADNQRKALAPGKRVSKSGNVYSERRRDRSDKPGQLAEYDTYQEYVYDQFNKPNWGGEFPVNIKFISDTRDSYAIHVSTRTIPIIIDFLESLLEEQPRSIVV